jgi:hypothetical protein
MKTTTYNPSAIEIELAKALVILQKEIEQKLDAKQITKISPDLSQDNPAVKITLVDKEGDAHDIVLKIVQLPDKA